MQKVYSTILFTIILLCLSVPVNAQVHLDLNVNIGSQPVWGPVGYDAVEYYYLPDIEAYYYVPQHVFYFYEGGRWISYSSLPHRHRNFDLYRSYKVVINESKPWKNHKSYKKKYYSYRNRHDQLVIRDSHDSRYFVNKNHPEHHKWKNEQKRDKSEYKENNYNENHDSHKGNKGNKRKK